MRLRSLSLSPNKAARSLNRASLFKPGTRATLLPTPSAVAGHHEPKLAGAGFTLLEMLIVLVISSIVMAALIPNFGPAIARAQLYSATRDVASALRHTRGQAMLTGQDALFELNTEQHLYRVTGRPKVYKLPPEVQLGLITTTTETLDEGTGRIRFFPDGSATGGRVTLIANRQTRVVDVNWLTGEVRMGEGDSDQ